MQSQKTTSGDDTLGRTDKSGKSDKPDKSANGVSASRLAALQSGKDATEVQVLAVRTSKAVDELMGAAQQKMNEVTNSYPPFLRGSEQRQQYLMSISSIRQQIEAMTIPPGKLDNPALDTASSDETKLMWAELFKDVGIPALATSGPNEASDAQIRAASSAIGAMRSDLTSRRAALEQLITPANLISSPMAQYLSQTAGQELAKTDISLTYKLTAALKGM